MNPFAKPKVDNKIEEDDFVIMTNEKNKKEDFDEYKKYFVCKLCHKKYGSDFQNDNGLCPICSKGKPKGI